MSEKTNIVAYDFNDKEIPFQLSFNNYYVENDRFFVIELGLPGFQAKDVNSLNFVLKDGEAVLVVGATKINQNFSIVRKVNYQSVLDIPYQKIGESYTKMENGLLRIKVKIITDNNLKSIPYPV